MLLEAKHTVIYGGGGGVGGAVARVFGREGATVDLVGRTQATLDAVVGPTMLKRAATLADVGNVAAFAASDLAQSITGSGINISCGAVLDPSMKANKR